MAVILLYVDDMLIASNDRDELSEIKIRLSNTFEMKDLGEPTSFLGISIVRNHNEKSLVIHQANYIENILERFNMQDCKPQSTPMVTRQVTNIDKKRKIEGDITRNLEDQEIENVPYRQAIRSLMYLSNATRPDITFAVHYIARKQLEPTAEDWMGVKSILRYLRGTTNKGLNYRAGTGELEAYTDAKYRDCQDSTSTGGYIIKLFGDEVGRAHV